jgi:hypothetical protein
MKRTVFLVFFFISTNYLFSQGWFGVRFSNSIGNSSQNEMAEIGSFVQSGIKIGSEDVFFSLLGDFRLFGYPQITGGLIAGINFPVNTLLVSFGIGGGFSNPKFTTIFDGELYQPYVRAIFLSGIKDNFVISFGAFFDYYFDSQNLYYHNFRTGLLLSVGNM